MNTLESLPATGFIRLKIIVGDRRTGVLGVLPVGTTTWWNGVRSGRFPQPVKLGPRITAWRVEDIRDLLERLGK